MNERIGQSDECRRWDKEERKYVNISCPEAIQLYNKNMGGVDKLDFLVKIYRSFIRSREWTLRMSSHPSDLGATNSWLEYRKDANALGIPKKDQFNLLHFRREIAEELMYESKMPESAPRVGRLKKEELRMKRKTLSSQFS